MSEGILRIKTSIPPLGAGVITRTRIQEQLEHGLLQDMWFLRRLTLVSAPAGYGKTTQVRAWLQGREDSVTWLSLDRGDNDPQRYWSHLVAAMQQRVVQLGGRYLEALRVSESGSTGGGAGAHLVALLNDLYDLDTPLHLVLDDYHHIENPAIQEDMIVFIENLPPRVHLILTTRSDPPWPLARWRARGSMMEIRLEDLRFTDEEVARLCEVHRETHPRLILHEPHLAVLAEKTEGWVAGLQLALISLTSRPTEVEGFLAEFDGSHRHVLHFLSEEILNHRSESMQEFLLQTAMLERFCAPLCDAVTGAADGEERIRELTRDNVFIIRLDEHGIWYRYHALFADLLRFRVQRLNPEGVPDIHRRAAHWFLLNNSPGEALHHAREATDLSMVAGILHDNYDKILASEGPTQLNGCLQEIPDDVLRSYPRLVLHRALYHLNYHGREDAERCLSLADSLGYKDAESDREFTAMRAVVQAFLHVYRNELESARMHAEQAAAGIGLGQQVWHTRLSLYSGDIRFFSANPRAAEKYYRDAFESESTSGGSFLRLTTAFKIAASLYNLGKLSSAEELTREWLAIALSDGLARVPRVGVLWGLLGELRRECADFTEAERCIERALVLSEQERPAWGWNALYRVALDVSRGALAEALHTAQEVEILSREARLPLFVANAASTWRARILATTGHAEEARDLLEALGVMPGRPVPLGLERAALVAARIIAGESDNQRYSSSCDLLDTVTQRAMEGGDERLLLESLLARSQAVKAFGQGAEAENALAQASEIGRRCGFYQIFVDEGLRPEEIIHRPATVANAVGAPAAATNSIRYGIVEELSEREIEILVLVGEGLSNEDIGESLYISPGTVKWHLGNVFGKLGVNKRTRAVAVARDIGIM